MSVLFFVDGDVDAITKLPNVPFEVICADSKTSVNIKKFNAASREDRAVLTNCVWLLNSVSFDCSGNPLLWFYAEGNWVNVCKLTLRHLRPGVNFEKLFLAGEFEFPEKAVSDEADFLRECGKRGLLRVTLNDKVILDRDVREYTFAETIKILKSCGDYGVLKHILEAEGGNPDDHWYCSSY